MDQLNKIKEEYEKELDNLRRNIKQYSEENSF